MLNFKSTFTNPLVTCFAVASGGSGYGSSGTVIRRFAVGATTIGNITYTASALNGDSWTIGDTGCYSMQLVDRASGGVQPFGFTRNQADLTSLVGNFGWPQLINYSNFPTQGGGIAGTAFLNAGDVIRINSQGANESITPQFVITRVW